MPCGKEEKEERRRRRRRRRKRRGSEKEEMEGMLSGRNGRGNKMKNKMIDCSVNFRDATRMRSDMLYGNLRSKL